MRSISTWDGELASAHAPQSVVLTLEDETDLSRGEMIASVADAPHRTRPVSYTHLDVYKRQGWASQTADAEQYRAGWSGTTDGNHYGLSLIHI